MNLPFFYSPDLAATDEIIMLNDETSKHVVRVLRMQTGELLKLTNGKGLVVTASIEDNHKNHCSVKRVTSVVVPAPANNKTIAISLTKNTARFEWFLEKATELGITEIVPLMCKRTEKTHFRSDRMQGIVNSAMLQSQQCWKTILSEPLSFEEVVMEQRFEKKFIAHCEAEDKKQLLSSLPSVSNELILIGPEGDFTSDEIRTAKAHDYMPVSLGETRLRTETAGITAAVLMQWR